MADSTRARRLALECSIFTTYLLGAAAPSDVVFAYQRAHEVSVSPELGVASPIDRAVMRVAVFGPSWARAADAFAAFFARAGQLRRKLVLLVAILESRGETAPALDTATPGSRTLWVVGVGAAATLSVLRLAGAAAIILPLGAWYTMSRGSRPAAGSGLSRPR